MTRTKISCAISLALVGAALAAGSAQAERPDDRAGMLGVGAALAAGPAQARPDDREGMLGVGAATAAFAAQSAVSTVTRPDDRGWARGPGTIASAHPVTTTGNAVGELEWRNASLGAAAMLAMVLLAGGIAHALRDRRHIGVS